ALAQAALVAGVEKPAGPQADGDSSQPQHQPDERFQPQERNIHSIPPRSVRAGLMTTLRHGRQQCAKSWLERQLRTTGSAVRGAVAGCTADSFRGRSPPGKNARKAAILRDSPMPMMVDRPAITPVRRS